jgi:uncharacterized protein YpmS
VFERNHLIIAPNYCSNSSIQLQIHPFSVSLLSLISHYELQYGRTLTRLDGVPEYVESNSFAGIGTCSPWDLQKEVLNS